MQKSPDAFRTISEVAADLDVPQHVLRFWETRFSTIRPLKRGGGRRYYRPDDVELLKGIRHLLYGQGYTIKGVQRILKEDGLRVVQAIGRGEQGVVPAPHPQDGDDDASDAAGLAAFQDEEPDAPASAPGAPPVQQGLSAEDLDQLRAVLDELRECQRILGTLRAD
jgi:DNA-binding transcriptional MerR regulator